MLPKNSRRPLTLDHKIRLKKQLAKAYKSAGISAESEGSKKEDASFQQARKRVHQDFKPRPQDKIIRKRQTEQEERDRLREEKDRQITERIEERSKSIQKRKEQNKKLSTKNKRGQPNLNNQIELLLGKITGPK